MFVFRTAHYIRVTKMLLPLAMAILASCGSSRTVTGSDATPVKKDKPTKSQTAKHVRKQPLTIPTEGLTDAQEKLMKEIQSWIGTPYRPGGKDRNGVDCSALVMEVYRNTTGIKLPRNSREQRDYCTEIPDTAALQAGDLVFFTSNSSSGQIAHVGMYVGNGNIIHASSSRGVIRSHLTQQYYTTHYHSSGRVPGLSVAATKPVAIAERTEVPPQPEQKQETTVVPNERTRTVVPVNASTVVKNAFGSAQKKTHNTQ